MAVKLERDGLQVRFPTREAAQAYAQRHLRAQGWRITPARDGRPPVVGVYDNDRIAIRSRAQ